MRVGRTICIALLLGSPGACGSSTLAVDPIFLEGRSVATAGDSLIAVTRPGQPGILVRRRRARDVLELGAGALRSPWHVQWSAGEWYVSDVEDGKPWVVVLSHTGEIRRRIPLAGLTRAPHQFAVLPDGRIVVEAPDGRLVAIAGDSTSVFTVTERASRTGLLVAAGGGVLHAVPDRYITVYNQFGHIRWRLDWPWVSTSYVSEVTVDPQSRVHVLLGVPRDSTFIAYTLSNQTGEVVIWSAPSRKATFVVDRLGKINEAKPEDWMN